MRGFEKLEAAELHERDVAARELDFEQGAVMRRPEQHRLRLERDARFTVLEHRVRDVARLVGFVAHADEPRSLGGGALGSQLLGEALLRQFHHCIGGGENGLGRAVVAIERDDLGARIELAGKVEDVAHGRGTERVDRLGIVAHDGEAAAAWLEAQQDRGLQPVGVLIFVHQHMPRCAWVPRPIEA